MLFKTHRLLRTVNDELKVMILSQTANCGQTRKLYSNRSTHIRSLCGWNVNSARNALRSRFGNDVEQHFTHFPRARSDRVALFVLKSVNLTVRVQGKNHRFSVHVYTTLLYPDSETDRTPVLNRTIRHPPARAPILMDCLIS